MPKPIAMFCLAGALLAACTTAPTPSPDFPETPWQKAARTDAEYLLAPGDELELTVYSAPELSRTVSVAPDGRVRLPLIAPIFAAGRTPDQLAAHVRAAYESELRSPDLDVLVTNYASQQVFVGGEVNTPGLFDLPGQIDPLQAIILAGGRTDRAHGREAFIMRRQPGGEVRTAVFDINAGLSDPALATWGPLQRFDVVYVPRSRIANQNLFIQQYIRQALPIEFSLFYDISGQDR